ncbi:MAG: immunity 26/phosphotriesterase HocA family protein [Pseudomonadota bacterium]|nr:immunity 26/phosphotriesterase HocA family protein [Pseudomonadota bacterium]
MNQSTQKKTKHSCTVGDVLAVPLPKERFGYVRIINIKDGWDLAEVLAVTTKLALFDDAVRTAAALYPPVSFSLNNVAAGLMKPVGHTSSFQPDYVKRLWYRRGIPGHYLKIRVNQSKSEGTLTNAEAADLPNQEFYAFEKMVQRVMERLAANRTVQDWLAAGPPD